MVLFSGKEGELRKERFVYALKTPASELRSDYLNPIRRDPSVEQVVFVMHGIRDFGHWTTSIQTQIQELASELGKKVEVVTPGYGYFPLLGFLLQPERQQNVRWFMDRYTEVLALYPRATISFIGHSNGTYLLASALERYSACKFDRVVFAGSVVYSRFPWSVFIQRGRVRAIQNYVATADWVVGIFPQLFEYFPHPDLGGAGHNGFTDAETHAHQIIYIKGQHGAAIVPENHPALAAFILGMDEVGPPAPLRAANQVLGVVLASRLCWLVWLLLILIFTAPIYLPLALGLSGHWHPSYAFCLLLWPLFLFMLLRTI
jgi:hypothetical protein